MGEALEPLLRPRHRAGLFFPTRGGLSVTTCGSAKNVRTNHTCFRKKVSEFAENMFRKSRFTVFAKSGKIAINVQNNR